MTENKPVVAGVDAHKDTHYAAVISVTGERLGAVQFPSTGPGYRALQEFITCHGPLLRAGVALGLEQDRYRVDAKLREHLMARTPTCEFPGCAASIRHTDADHILDWRKGGKTNPENLQLLCRKHHNMKTHLGWQCRRLEDGRTEWTSPLGAVFYAAPVPLEEPPF